ncbi:hypothetical protein ACJVDH_15360 [Pedobacter sp. AW1-32]|uniref:hypothetical protein n=1 Tax=Pedobacter sp. AW1-32 TaxID=3383026 RepID=UPI003FEF0CE2
MVISEGKKKNKPFRWLILFVFIGISCVGRNIDNENPTKQILASSIELLDGASISTLRQSVNIYCFKNTKMYEIPLYNEATVVRVNRSGDILNEKIKSDTTHNLFVFKDGDETGIKYSNYKDSITTIFDVDSLLKKNAYKGVNFYDQKNDSLVLTRKENDQNYVEFYVPRKKFDESYADTTIFYLKKNNSNFGYSFSSELEKQKNGYKVHKVIFIYNPTHNKRLNIDAPRRKMEFELREDTIYNTKHLIQIFDRFINRRR